MNPLTLGDKRYSGPVLALHILVPSDCLRSFTKESDGLWAVSLGSVSVTEKPVLEIPQRGTMRLCYHF